MICGICRTLTALPRIVAETTGGTVRPAFICEYCDHMLFSQSQSPRIPTIGELVTRKIKKEADHGN